VQSTLNYISLEDELAVLALAPTSDRFRQRPHSYIETPKGSPNKIRRDLWGVQAEHGNAEGQLLALRFRLHQDRREWDSGVR